MTDSARVVRWTGPVFCLFSMILLPWTVYVAASLPPRQVYPNYDTAWAGFDVMLLVALAGTAYFALRRSPVPVHCRHRQPPSCWLSTPCSTS